MESKIFELRSPATLIVIMATKLDVHNEAERYLLSRSGFGRTSEDFNKYILLQTLDESTNTATTDPYRHGISELRIAHCYIQETFDILENGQVLDIEYILGNVSKPKEPEQIQVNRELFYLDLIESLESESQF